MPIQSKLLRDQAARFLALSTKAREEGDSDLADLFTEAAADCLGKIVAAECAEASAPHVDSRQPVAQQQQQERDLRPAVGVERNNGIGRAGVGRSMDDHLIIVLRR